MEGQLNKPIKMQTMLVLGSNAYQSLISYCSRLDLSDLLRLLFPDVLLSSPTLRELEGNTTLCTDGWEDTEKLLVMLSFVHWNIRGLRLWATCLH